MFQQYSHWYNLVLFFHFGFVCFNYNIGHIIINTIACFSIHHPFFNRGKMRDGNVHDLIVNLEHVPLQKPFEWFLFVQDLFLNRKTHTIRFLIIIKSVHPSSSLDKLFAVLLPTIVIHNEQRMRCFLRQMNFILPMSLQRAKVSESFSDLFFHFQRNFIFHFHFNKQMNKYGTITIVYSNLQ